MLKSHYFSSKKTYSVVKYFKNSEFSGFKLLKSERKILVVIIKYLLVLARLGALAKFEFNIILRKILSYDTKNEVNLRVHFANPDDFAFRVSYTILKWGHSDV